MGFLLDWRKFRCAGGEASLLSFYPCLFDKTTSTAIDSHYFYQAIWAFKKILASGVSQHVDIGSDVQFVGMLTCVTEVTFVDIRPLELTLSNYIGKKGSILALPFHDKGISSLSSLHVIEHIGLGRYGDPIDPDGSIKACRELMRVLAPGGKLYLSVPIGKTRVQFNGQRVFNVTDVIAMFSDLELLELSVVNTDGTYMEKVNPDTIRICEEAGLDYGLGMFVFSAERSQ